MKGKKGGQLSLFKRSSESPSLKSSVTPFSMQLVNKIYSDMKQAKGNSLSREKKRKVNKVYLKEIFSRSDQLSNIYKSSLNLSALKKCPIIRDR